MMSGNEFKFFLSCDINLPVRLKIESLEGSLSQVNENPSKLSEVPTKLHENSPTLPTNGVGQCPDTLSWKRPNGRADSELVLEPELCVEAVLTLDGVPFGLPVRTRHDQKASGGSAGKQHRWSEWVTLCVKYRDLTANAQVALTVWNVADPRREIAVGGATLNLFSGRKQLKSGRQKLRLWLGREADGGLRTATPGKVPKKERGEVERLEKLLNKYERSELARADWLDKLAFRAIERIREENRKKLGTSHLDLIVELPSFEHPVAYQELGAPLLSQPLSATNDLVKVYDPEVGRQNPSEEKQLKLARGVNRGLIDKDLKPNSAERKEIAAILLQPPSRDLTGEERQVLWRFRFSLTNEKRALTKFLKCVDWSDAQESKQATDLMHRWASIDIADALELLSPAFVSEEVRSYAVSVLEKADDEELLCYLLQLVQALRYERSDHSRLASFLVQRAVAAHELSNLLHWYLIVEWQDPTFSNRYSVTHQKLVTALLQAGPTGERTWDEIRRQSELTAQLCAIVRECKSVRGNNQKKIERLRSLLSSQGLLGELTHFQQPLPLPLNPRIYVQGIVASESSIFKSALSPLRLTFKTDQGGRVRIIFKKGDDLRQDQLVIQMVSLMDRLLKKENLDLKLTPYRVLATSSDDGMMEFVPSVALATVLAEHRTLTGYLKLHAPQEDGPFGIQPDVVETFVKSCAGYCVIMYILGVGDRHLDNLMLCQDGRLFHIDFGFILGRDPKPFPPPMKLCKEMVEAMGGQESPHYNRFKSYCCEAYNILRKNANLILNLLHLMAGANIPDIANDPEKGVLKLQEKFRLDLDDEEAVQYFQTLINDSVSALFPQMVETIHRWAQYWR